MTVIIIWDKNLEVAALENCMLHLFYGFLSMGILDLQSYWVFWLLVIIPLIFLVFANTKRVVLHMRQWLGIAAYRFSYFIYAMVAGLSFRTTEESLRNAFQNFGQLVEGECCSYISVSYSLHTYLHCYCMGVLTWICLWIGILWENAISDQWGFVMFSFFCFSVNLVMDRIANRPRGFAFLRYATEEESKKAIEGMHGKVCQYFCCMWVVACVFRHWYVMIA